MPLRPLILLLLLEDILSNMGKCKYIQCLKCNAALYLNSDIKNPASTFGEKMRSKIFCLERLYFKHCINFVISKLLNGMIPQVHNFEYHFVSFKSTLSSLVHTCFLIPFVKGTSTSNRSDSSALMHFTEKNPFSTTSCEALFDGPNW